MKKILIFKKGAIGDLLMTTPLIKQIGENGTYEIDYMCGEKSAQVLQGNKYIKNIIPFDETCFSRNTIKHRFKYIKFLFNLFFIHKKYDAVFILDRHIIYNFTFFITGFKNRFGFNRMGKEGKFLNQSIFWDKSKREVEYYINFCEFLGIKADYKKQKYYFFSGIIDTLNGGKQLNENEQNLVKQYIKNKNEIDYFLDTLKQKGKKIIAISTGGGNIFIPNNDCRWWDLKNWEDLTKKLIENNYIVLNIGSKNDRFLNINNENFHHLLGKYNIFENIYLISKIDVLITQDSGSLHFGGCTDTKTIGLFGPTSPFTKFPYDNNGKKINYGWIWKEQYECMDEYGSYNNCNGNEINKITINDVLSAI